MLLHLLIDIVVGLAAGFVAGLLGTGNSLVVLPALIFVFSESFVPNVAFPLAVGTNLAICGISILFAALLHSRHHKIDWQIFKAAAPGYFIGSLAGPWAARLLPVHALKIYIAVFIFIGALTLLMKEKQREKEIRPPRKIFFVSSAIVSFFSSISGMASGVLMVPYLTAMGVSIRKAISIALPGAVIFSFTAMTGYMITGWHAQNLPSGSVGYVYLPTAVIVSLAAASASFLGVKLHHKMDVNKLKKLFSVLLIIAGIFTLRA